MNYTMTRIGALQLRLNELVSSTDLCTGDQSELYTLSQQLDELIVNYYKEKSM